METRKDWEIFVRATFENIDYFLGLGVPGTHVRIIDLPDKSYINGGWAIQPKRSSFYIAFCRTENDAYELAANCGWKVIP